MAEEVKKRKLVSVATGCFNEAGNIRELYERIKAVFAGHPQYDWELVIADNHSTDGTVEVLESLAAADRRVKVIFNSRNFGHLRSPFNAVLNTSGDAVAIMVSDLQEPPEMLHEFLVRWEAGIPAVCGVRSESGEAAPVSGMRKLYYRMLRRVSDDAEVIPDFTGFGLYDRKVIDAIRRFDEPYPYLRGLLSEVGFERVLLPFRQQKRKAGRTKNNLFTLYDCAMTGFVNHTTLPLRLATFSGFVIAGASLAIALVYLVLKILRWQNFSLGLAPIMIGIFFLGAVQLIFIGILGEYLGAVWRQVKHRPLVIEERRLNFDDPAPAPRGEAEK